MGANTKCLGTSAIGWNRKFDLNGVAQMRWNTVLLTAGDADGQILQPLFGLGQCSKVEHLGYPFSVEYIQIQHFMRFILLTLHHYLPLLGLSNKGLVQMNCQFSPSNMRGVL